MELKRNCNLDFLKVLACLAVIGLHVFTYNYDNTLITYIHFMFGYAVPVFFMVNGYLILNKAEVTYPYVFRKILHIIVIVVLWNAVYCAAELVIKQKLENPILLVIKSLVQRGYFWQFWFLGAMILTYLAAPLLFKCIHHFNSGYMILLGVFLAVCILVDVLNFIMHRPAVGEKYFQTFKIWQWMFYFVFGGYAKTLIQKLSDSFSMKWHVAAVICLFLGFPLYQLYASDAINFNEYYVDPIAILNNTCMFTVIMRIKCSEKMNIPITLLSTLGMGCYIIHPVILTFVDRYIDYSYVFLPFLIFPVITAVSYGVTYLMRKIKITSYFVDL